MNASFLAPIIALISFALTGCVLNANIASSKNAPAAVPCISGTNCFGDIDISFGTNGKVQFFLDGVDNIDQYGQGPLAISGANKILFAADGIYTTSGPSPVTYSTVILTRLNENGSIDTNFGSGGVRRLNLAANVTSRALLDVNGNIFLAAQINGVRSLAKLNTIGNLDTSFGSLGSVSFPGYTIADGLFVLNNQFYITGQTAGPFDIAISSADMTGAIVSSYGTSGTALTAFPSDEFGFGYEVDSAGRILISTQAYINATVGFNMAVTRFNTNGVIDTSFGSGGSVNFDFFGGRDATWSITRSPVDSTSLLVGEVQHAAAADSDLAIVKIDDNGNKVSGFGTNGSFVFDMSAGGDDFAKQVFIHDGKIIVIGQTMVAGLSKVFILRLTSNGNLDSTFNSVGYKIYSQGSNNDLVVGAAIDSLNRLVLMTGSSNGSTVGISLMRIFL